MHDHVLWYYKYYKSELHTHNIICCLLFLLNVVNLYYEIFTQCLCLMYKADCSHGKWEVDPIKLHS